ncbi:MAG: restriction endonuclease subunit S [Burkholderiales bacterium]|nr:restriction endonuclease subunit S [Burkholderiales bacterium]
MKGLPESWTDALLGEIAEVQMGQSPNSATYNDLGVGLPFFQGKAEFGSLYPTVRKWCSEPIKVARVGDILLSVRAPVGPTNVAATDCCIGRGLAALRVAQPLNQTYLLHYLRSIQDWLAKQGTGTTFAAISGDLIRQLQVPLCPAAEQKRIADKLDAILARVDACRDRLYRVFAILKRFREAVLSAAVRGQLSQAWREATEANHSARPPRLGPDLSSLAVDEKPSDRQLQEWMDDLPDGWRVERASLVVETGADIVYGIVQPGPKLAAGVPYVRGMDIVNGEIRVEQLLRTSPEIAQRYARASIKGGDVLLGIIRATKVAVVPESLNGANITQGTARFRPSQKILTRYLATVLEAPETQRWLHGHYRGIDMPGLNLADVRRVPIPLPSLEEQAEVIRQVDSLLSVAISIEARLVTARAQVDRLTPALLAKGFRGELVPQDPSDEPARTLLARVAAAKQAPSPSRAGPPSTRSPDLKPSPKPKLLEVIDRMPKADFSFDELRQVVGGDYESLKGDLFELLSDKSSGVEQFFDVKVRSMKLRRARK